MPFGPYADFAECVADNQDKDDPESYCAALERQLKEDTAEVADGNLPLMRVDTTEQDTVLPSKAAEMPVDGLEDETLPDATGYKRKDFTALVIQMGVETGDGRIYENVSWRNPPLPLMALDTTTEMHLEARLVGNFDEFYVDGTDVWGSGHFVESTDPQVLALQDLIRSGELRGISADMDMVEGELLIDTNEEQDMPEPDESGIVTLKLSAPKFRATSARLIGATAVPFPAFADTYIEPVTASGAGRQRVVTGHLEDVAALVASTYDDINFQPPRGAREEAEKGLRWRQEYGRGGTEVGVARARDIKRGANLSPDTVRRMASYFARHAVDKQGQGWNPGEDGFPSAGRIAWALWGGDPGETWANKVKGQMEVRDERGSARTMVASVEAPVFPPANWFTNPQLTAGTPLTVDDNGRVFGHLALWNSCHIGFPDQCVTPPRSLTNYAHFATGEIVCQGGVRVAVGQITVDSGHAPLDRNPFAAKEHYDQTGWAAADVAVGEDEFGIWMAGALRPGLEPEAIRKFMAADVSGDWRRTGTNLELVAVASVNVGGFPKVRFREQQAGIVASLVAAVPVCGGSKQDAHKANQRRIAERIAASIGRGRAARVASLYNRVHKVA